MCLLLGAHGSRFGQHVFAQRIHALLRGGVQALDSMTDRRLEPRVRLRAEQGAGVPHRAAGPQRGGHRARLPSTSRFALNASQMSSLWRAHQINCAGRQAKIQVDGHRCEGVRLEKTFSAFVTLRNSFCEPIVTVLVHRY